MLAQLLIYRSAIIDGFINYLVINLLHVLGLERLLSIVAHFVDKFTILETMIQVPTLLCNSAYKLLSVDGISF